MSDRSNPVICDIKLHVVWHTKNNLHILTPAMKERLLQILRDECAVKKIRIISGGKVSSNHVYMRVICPPRIALSEMMRFFKGRSSRLLQQEFPELAQYNLGGALWGSGYFCAPIEACGVEAVDDYIAGKVI